MPKSRSWANRAAGLYCRWVPHVMQCFRRSALIGHILVVCAACAFAACSVYDARLIDSKPPQAVAMMPAAGRPAPAAGGGGAGGASGQAGADVSDHDGGEDDRDATLPTTKIPVDVHCGDGRVTGDEKCDIGIPAGTPGSCPTSCPELAPCNPRAVNNSGCQAECVLLQMVCKAGDGCCPGNCTDKNDADCSSNCGDGKVQAEDGETCEAETATPCKKSDAECDDKDPCTADKLIGSAENCNALCTNTKITATKEGDGCCPTGSNANSDKDCTPVCGNKVREMGEDCDGTTGCSATCKLTLQADQIRCLEKLGNAGDDCAKCSCMNCAATYLGCRDGMDATMNMLCNAVLECARKQDCYGTACYCGDSLFCAAPNGLCRKEIEAAAASTDPLVINQKAGVTDNPLGSSYAADACRIQQCAQQCRPR